ncbi:predicted protein [Postia placenta Mad-698-R]|nr:predicted protein [Postia placenta Mad-698-R]
MGMHVCSVFFVTVIVNVDATPDNVLTRTLSGCYSLQTRFTLTYMRQRQHRGPEHRSGRGEDSIADWDLDHSLFIAPYRFQDEAGPRKSVSLQRSGWGEGSPARVPPSKDRDGAKTQQSPANMLLSSGRDEGPEAWRRPLRGPRDKYPLQCSRRGNQRAPTHDSDSLVEPRVVESAMLRARLHSGEILDRMRSTSIDELARGSTSAPRWRLQTENGTTLEQASNKVHFIPQAVVRRVDPASVIMRMYRRCSTGIFLSRRGACNQLQSLPLRGSACQLNGQNGRAPCILLSIVASRPTNDARVSRQSASDLEDRLQTAEAVMSNHAPIVAVEGFTQEKM